MRPPYLKYKKKYFGHFINIISTIVFVKLLIWHYDQRSHFCKKMHLHAIWKFARMITFLSVLFLLLSHIGYKLHHVISKQHYHLNLFLIRKCIKRYLIIDSSQFLRILVGWIVSARAIFNVGGFKTVRGRGGRRNKSVRGSWPALQSALLRDLLSALHFSLYFVMHCIGFQSEHRKVQTKVLKL